jgi:ubiquinone/menaquinone biosynthesis C-methylase UbiE
MQQLPPDQGRRGLSQRVFAWWYRNSDDDSYELRAKTRKEGLFAQLSGLVVEIGPGTGANFPYYPKTVQWVGIEPNTFMHETLSEEARQHGFAPQIHAHTAEHLPFDDNSVDAVVSTLVLCSVNDQARVLREILRVLKPGGRYLFIEHVAAPRGTSMRRWQRFIRPLWRIVGDGCRPDRETWVSIQNAGFTSLHLEHFQMPLWLASPHIAGTAVK